MPFPAKVDAAPFALLGLSNGELSFKDPRRTDTPGRLLLVLLESTKYSAETGKIRSQSRPRGCATRRAIIGEMLTLGYLREKKRLMDDPKTANSNERVHMRGVLMLTNNCRWSLLPS
jgi:hypothetical protein